MSSDPCVGGLVEHLFRRQAGRLVASLTRLLGPERLDLAEEVVQDAIVRALETWPHRGIPDDPAAWLARVARNRAVDLLRREASLREKLVSWDPGAPTAMALPMDDELALVFLCCHPALTREACVALTLRTAGGFGTAEIARAFLVEPPTIAQRLVRAKRALRAAHAQFDLPRDSELHTRIEAVLDVLYLMFNEGYEAASGDALVRAELCGEAIRLVERLADSPATAQPQVDALLALMYLQASRLDARTDETGALMLLDAQDRARWDGAMIGAGLRVLDRSARGEQLSRYHIEAAIAACHAVAARFEDTDWPRIAALYEQLQSLHDSPVVALNRAVALSMTQGPAAAIEFLAGYEHDPAMQRYVLFHATRGELLRRAGRRACAIDAFEHALRLPASAPERAFIHRRIAQCATLTTGLP